MTVLDLNYLRCTHVSYMDLLWLNVKLTMELLSAISHRSCKVTIGQVNRI